MRSAGQPNWEGFPFFARIAGLKAISIEPFGSDLPERLAAGEALQLELDHRRAELATRLGAALPELAADLRRLALTVRRDCFNSRSLDRHEKDLLWSDLRHQVGPPLDRVLNLQREIGRWRQDFESEFERERERQRGHLAGLLAEEGFLHGLALASGALLGAASRLAPGTRAVGRRERKLEASLLRYVSRAALKLSPYSSLTCLALGRIRADGEGPDLELVGTGRYQTSALRLQRYLLDQFWAVLASHDPVRAGLEVVLNDTTEEIAPDNYRLVRPEAWALDAGSGVLAFSPESLATVRLSGRPVAWLRAELARSRPTYAQLLSRFDAEFGRARQSSREAIDSLLRVGFLQLLPPWPSNELHLERRLADHLRLLPPGSGLEPVLQPLERILSIEAHYRSMLDPAGAILELEALIEQTWQAILRLSGRGEARRSRAKKNDFYEDVLRLPVPGQHSGPEVVRLSERTARRLAREAEPLLRLSHLFNHRHDFLYTAAAVAAKRWPEAREVGILDLFRACQPLWQEYVSFSLAARRGEGWRSTFDPLALSSIKDLHTLREQVWEGVVAAVNRSVDESHVVPADLEAVLHRVPARFAPVGGACLFLQPIAGGRRWVLNRLYEGTGRFGSRFTPLLTEEVRREYAKRFIACSTVASDGEPGELLDLLCVRGDTLNVHSLQTPRVLEIPGYRPDPAGHPVNLQEIRVRLDFPLPRLVDGAGKVLLPVHLGGVTHDFIPPLVRFLALFGPGEIYKPVIPPASFRDEGEVTIRCRLVLGDLVLLRKRWIVDPSRLRPLLLGATESEAFAIIDRWRRQRTIPDKVFMIERVGREGAREVYKPQYVDFASPLFVSLFRSAIANHDDRLDMEEMLPSAGSFMTDGEGSRWAVEIQLDTLGLGGLTTALPSSVSLTGAGISTTTEARLPARLKGGSSGQDQATISTSGAASIGRRSPYPEETFTP
jgi:hypothetical protein